MKNQIWTIKYDSITPDFLCGKKISFKKVGLLNNDYTIYFCKNDIFLMVKVDISDFENNDIIKSCVESFAEEIVDIISWRYNMSISNLKIRKGNPYNIIENKRYILSDISYKNIFYGEYSEKTREILSAYREMKNEKNDALRFLICYRLLEIFSKNKKIKNVEDLINDLNPNINKINDKRNPKNKVDIITYTRNKIHATKKGFSFPYKDLIYNVKYIENLVRKMIKREIPNN